MTNGWKLGGLKAAPGWWRLEQIVLPPPRLQILVQDDNHRSSQILRIPPVWSG
jgi:hypothetical protein